MYEYYYKYEKEEFHSRRREEDDKIVEDRKYQADMDWADQLEAEEAAAAAKKPQQKPENLIQDPQNVEWMKQQIEKDKAQYDDPTFGENIAMNFEDEDT